MIAPNGLEGLLEHKSIVMGTDRIYQCTFQCAYASCTFQCALTVNALFSAHMYRCTFQCALTRWRRFIMISALVRSWHVTELLCRFTWRVAHWVPWIKGIFPVSCAIVRARAKKFPSCTRARVLSLIGMGQPGMWNMCTGPSSVN